MWNWTGLPLNEGNCHQRNTSSYKFEFGNLIPAHQVLSLIPSFSLPDMLCDPTDFIWRKWIPFEGLTGRTAPSSYGLLAEGFLGCKANGRKSVHSPQDHFIITLIISDWRDTRGKWPLARNLDRSWWHRHTNWKFFWLQPMAPWTAGIW